jgi:hypothetical protein
MQNLRIDFSGDGSNCFANIELMGADDSCIAHAKAIGPPSVREVSITSRLDDQGLTLTLDSDINEPWEFIATFNAV